MDQAETDAKVALGTAGRPQCDDRDGDGIIDTLDAVQINQKTSTVMRTETAARDQILMAMAS